MATLVVVERRADAPGMGPDVMGCVQRVGRLRRPEVSASMLLGSSRNSGSSSSGATIRWGAID